MIRAQSARPLVRAGFIVWMAAAVPQMATWASGRSLTSGKALSFGAQLMDRSRSRATLRRGRGYAGRRSTGARLAERGFTRRARDWKHRLRGGAALFVAGETPLVVGERTGLVWIVAQTVAMAVVDWVSPYRGRASHLSAFAYAGFAIRLRRLAARRTRSASTRRASARACRTATRELFADGNRTAERLPHRRASFGTLGHNLTA